MVLKMTALFTIMYSLFRMGGHVYTALILTLCLLLLLDRTWLERGVLWFVLALVMAFAVLSGWERACPDRPGLRLRGPVEVRGGGIHERILSAVPLYDLVFLQIPLMGRRGPHSRGRPPQQLDLELVPGPAAGWPRFLARHRDELLLAFIIGTFSLVPIVGFGFLLTTLGLAQCRQDRSKIRLAYLIGFLLMPFCWYNQPIKNFLIAWWL